MISAQPYQPYFNYSLSCDVNITGFVMKNTHNDMLNDAGTKAYKITDLSTNSTIVESTLPSSQYLVRFIFVMKRSVH